MAVFKDKMKVSILTDYSGVVTGVLADNTARANNRTAINAAIVDAWTNGYTLLIPPGTYEIHGGPLIFANGGQSVRGDFKTIIKQYQLSAPAIHVGAPLGTATTITSGVMLDGLNLRWNGTGTSGANGLELTGCVGCSFRNIMIGDFNVGSSAATSVPYIGIYMDPASGTSPCYSNRFENITVFNYSCYGLYSYRNSFDVSPGNHYDNLHIANGTVGDFRDVSALSGQPIIFSSVSNAVFNNLYIRYVTAKSAIFLEVSRGILFNSPTIEGVVLKNTGGIADAGLISLYQSLATVNCALVRSTTVNSANSLQNPSVARLQDNSVITIDGLYMENTSKTGITNFALVRNWDTAGNVGCYANLANIALGNGDLLDLIDGITYSTGNDGPGFGQLSDFNNDAPLTLADASATLYMYRKPGILIMTPTTGRTLTLSRQVSASNTTRIPRGTRRTIRKAAGGTNAIAIANYDGSVIATIGTADQSTDVAFDGTNWRLVGTAPGVAPPVVPVGGPGGYTTVMVNDIFGSSRTDQVANITSVSQFNPSTPYGLTGTGWDRHQFWGDGTQANIAMMGDHLEIYPVNTSAAPGFITSHFEALPTVSASYYWEVRAAVGRGALANTWPAIWLYIGNEVGANDQQDEIDIMENYVDQAFGSTPIGGKYVQYFNSTIHGLPSHAVFDGPKTYLTTGTDITTTYNVYGCELTLVAGKVRWKVYFNGTLVNQASGGKDIAWASSAPAMTIGWNPGSTSESPAIFKLDYVRCWVK